MMTARAPSKVEWLGSCEFGSRPAESEVCGRYRLERHQHSGLVLPAGLQFLIQSEGKGDGHRWQDWSFCGFGNIEVVGDLNGRGLLGG